MVLVSVRLWFPASLKQWLGWQPHRSVADVHLAARQALACQQCTTASAGSSPPATCHLRPRWAAPEMMQDAEPHDERADSWSLGATALELLTRALPWPKDSIPDSTHAGGLLLCQPLLCTSPLHMHQPACGICHTSACTMT
jgi:serine/threonine protein kinase